MRAGVRRASETSCPAASPRPDLASTSTAYMLGARFESDSERVVPLHGAAGGAFGFSGTHFGTEMNPKLTMSLDACSSAFLPVRSIGFVTTARTDSFSRLQAGDHFVATDHRSATLKVYFPFVSNTLGLLVMLRLCSIHFTMTMRLAESHGAHLNVLLNGLGCRKTSAKRASAGSLRDK